jgi:putative membrane protein insertion efficiency factor
MTRIDLSPFVLRNVRVTRRWVTRLLVTVYRVAISPMIIALAGPGCRFEPTCSEYAGDAIAEHGFIAGVWMAIRRIGRCRPGGGWGYDPVRPRHIECHQNRDDGDEAGRMGARLSG